MVMGGGERCVTVGEVLSRLLLKVSSPYGGIELMACALATVSICLYMHICRCATTCISVYLSLCLCVIVHVLAHVYTHVYTCVCSCSSQTVAECELYYVRHAA